MTTEPAEPSPGAAPAPAAPAAPPAGPPTPAASPWAAPSAETPAAAPTAAPAAPPAGPPAPPASPWAGPPLAPDLAAPAPEQAPRAPRRPRPVLLTVCGLVLGTLAGGGVGYAVQAQRPPTPLPPLQVARPSYPAVVVDPTAFAAEQPRPLAIDGDLLKLLMSAPQGSGPWGDYPDKPSWVSVGELAERAGNSVREFKDLNSRGFRRAAEVDWKKDDVKYRVSLIQYAPENASEAKLRASLSHLLSFADGANGGYKVEDQPSRWAETTDQYYYGVAVAQRGTVLMSVEVFGTKPVNPDVVKDLAKQQWERLA
ncbi:hypothetical protein ACFYUY_21705 [Kitasatospora sp. NPDC004745]|uniref:hypothetical protein n=1 Tax=Kitasatospora sp. NPDC004745 TaxID=3364019 RepID=UPI00369DE2DE